MLRLILSCRGVIVCSVVCCASPSLALKCVSARCLLTLCLTAIGSYMKPACRKNTFHINLLGPLVETFALMNHDLSERGGRGEWGRLCPTDRPARSHLAGYLVCHWETASGSSLDNRPLFPASVLLRGLPGQMESVMHWSCSGRAEQRVHGCQGYGRTRDIFHPSRERRKGAERTDKQRTEEQSSRFFPCKAASAVCRKGVSTAGRIFFFSSPSKHAVCTV